LLNFYILWCSDAVDGPLVFFSQKQFISLLYLTFSSVTLSNCKNDQLKQKQHKCACDQYSINVVFVLMKISIKLFCFGSIFCLVLIVKEF